MTHNVENDAPESPFGPLDASGHDGHAAQLNGLLADCPGCVTPPGPCPDTGMPVESCLCMTHDPDGAHFRTTRNLPPVGGDA